MDDNKNISNDEALDRPVRRKVVRKAGTEQPEKKRRPVDENGNPVPAKKRRPVDENGNPVPAKKRRPVDENGNPRPVKKARPVTDGTEQPVRKKRPRPVEEREPVKEPVQRRRIVEEEPPRKKPVKKKNGALKVVITVVVVGILIIGLLGGSLLMTKTTGTHEMYDLNAYFEIQSDGQAGLTLNNEVILEPCAYIDGETAYVTYAFVRDHLTSRLYWDRENNQLLYTLPDGIVRQDAGAEAEGTVAFKVDGDEAYIALDYVKQYTDIEYVVTTESAVPHVSITSEWGEATTADIAKDTVVRYRGGTKSPVLEEIKAGEKVIVLDTVEDWKAVRTPSGMIGYVKKNSLEHEKIEELKSSNPFKEAEYPDTLRNFKINLGWHQVMSAAANGSIETVLHGTKGLNVISPTWFAVLDEDGNISSSATSEYMDYAHREGLEVWALVDNFTNQFDDLALLSSASARENLISQLMAEVRKYGIEGINVDFEQIQEEEGEHYIQFIRELSLECRKEGIVLSVDNYVPYGFNAHYHREEQAVFADYVIIMGYDEHYAGAPEAGSVASYPYVRAGVEKALEDVPANKLINAVPFYTRIWTHADDGLKSEAVAMSVANNLVNSKGYEVHWDDQTMQNYAIWTDANGNAAETWLEDAQSLEYKLGLIYEYNLAGVAEWKLGFEDSEVWDLIVDALR